MPALPSLPGLPVTKILVYFFTVVFALVAGIAAGTIIFKIQNPDAQINFGPIKQGGASPTPSQSPIISVPTPTPVPTPASVIPDNWLTYSNPILGFEFSYPPEAIIESDDLRGAAIQGSLISPAEFTYFVTAKFDDSNQVYIASSVNITDPAFLPVDPKVKAEALKAENQSDSGTGLQMTITEATLDRNPAYRVESVNSEQLVYFLLSQGKVPASEISISVIADKSRAQTVEQIINSFQFID